MNEAKKRILLVDDDEAIVETIHEYLSLSGYDVDVAKTGKEALIKAKDHHYDIAILDIHLPDMDGTELLTKLPPSEPKTMKIMLTGYPNYYSSAEVLNLGADAYLVKPVELERLLSVIEEKLKE